MSTYQSLIHFNVSTKAQASINTIVHIPSGQIYDFATLALVSGNGKAALAQSNLRHQLYNCKNMEFTIPLHRISSKADNYGRIDGATCVGTYGRNVKIALREIEGVFSSTPLLPTEKCPVCKKKNVIGCSRLPSVHGLPAPQPIKIKKKKDEVKGSDEEKERNRQNALNKSKVQCVSETVIKPIVDLISGYIATHGIDPSDAYKHLPDIMDHEKVPAAKKRRTK